MRYQKSEGDCKANSKLSYGTRCIERAIERAIEWAIERALEWALEWAQKRFLKHFYGTIHWQPFLLNKISLCKVYPE